MFGLGMDRLVPALKVLVGSRDIGMTGLIAGNDYALIIGEITNSGILEAVELIDVRPF